MYIGEASKITGASVKAIRLYQELGLLINVGRSGKYRVYTQEHITLISLILQAKALGFKLAEMKQLADREAHVEPWACILQMISDKQATLAADAKRLAERQAALSQYFEEITDCLANNPNCSLDQNI